MESVQKIHPLSPQKMILVNTPFVWKYVPPKSQQGALPHINIFEGLRKMFGKTLNFFSNSLHGTRPNKRPKWAAKGLKWPQIPERIRGAINAINKPPIDDYD